MRRAAAPHSDDLVTAVNHFNTAFRQRYRLPTTTVEAIRECDGLEEAIADLAVMRAEGVADASCALIARCVLSTVPRYAIGLIDGVGRVALVQPDSAQAEMFRSQHVLLVNPLGGYDNWSSVARWIKRIAGDKRRRVTLASLASERRPDEESNWGLLTLAAASHRRAIVLPPDEAFSMQRAAEVSYIYGVPVDTLRAWKQRFLKDRAAKRPGAPRQNR